MRTGEPWLFHGALSPHLDTELLLPEEVCRRAEVEWRAGRVPLASAEGFIRRIPGRRQGLRGVYWLHMPGQAACDALGADRPPPAFSLERKDRDGLRPAGDRADPAAGPLPPHPTARGEGELCASPRRAAGRGLRTAPRGLRGCLRPGGALEHARHGAARRRWDHGLEALCRIRHLPRPDGRSPPALSARPEGRERPDGPSLRLSIGTARSASGPGSPAIRASPGCRRAGSPGSRPMPIVSAPRRAGPEARRIPFRSAATSAPSAPRLCRTGSAGSFRKRIAAWPTAMPSSRKIERFGCVASSRSSIRSSTPNDRRTPPIGRTKV